VTTPAGPAPDTDGRTPGPAAPVVDRAAALAAGPPGVPRKFVYWLLAGAVVLSLGGLAGEHLFSSAGLNPVAAPAPKPRPAPAPAPTGAGSAPVRSSQAALMGLTVLPRSPAPGFSLVDQDGQVTSLAAQVPRVVVLSFFNGPCNDICPVLGAEIRQADADLGAAAARVEFLTVNTDPLALAASGPSAALAQTGLGALANWRLLTGPLATMDSVWKAYGVSITVDPKTGLEAHSDLLYFVDPHGDLRFRATPFADESRTGTDSLPPATIDLWARGIAVYASRLATP
jgi:protein SCO1/2